MRLMARISASVSVMLAIGKNVEGAKRTAAANPEGTAAAAPAAATPLCLLLWQALHILTALSSASRDPHCIQRREAYENWRTGAPMCTRLCRCKLQVPRQAAADASAEQARALHARTAPASCSAFFSSPAGRRRLQTTRSAPLPAELRAYHRPLPWRQPCPTAVMRVQSPRHSRPDHAADRAGSTHRSGASG